MRYRVITLMLGISLTAVSVSGCGRTLNPGKTEIQTQTQTEPQSIEVMDMEVVSGAENAVQTEAAPAGELSYQTEKTAQVSQEESSGAVSDGQEAVLDEETGLPSGAAGEAENTADIDAAAETEDGTQEKRPSAGRIWQGITTWSGEEDDGSGTGSAASDAEPEKIPGETTAGKEISATQAAGQTVEPEETGAEEVLIIEEEAGGFGAEESVTETKTAAAESETEPEPGTESADTIVTAGRSAEASGEVSETEGESGSKANGDEAEDSGDAFIEVVDEDGIVTEFETEPGSGTEATPEGSLAGEETSEAESGSEAEIGDGLSVESGNEAESEDEQSVESENETEEETAGEQQMNESESEADFDETESSPAGEAMREAESGSETEAGDEQSAESESEEVSETESSPESSPAEEAMREAESGSETESGNEQSAESENETDAETAEEQQMSESESEADFDETESSPENSSAVEAMSEAESGSEAESEDGLPAESESETDAEIAEEQQIDESESEEEPETESSLENSPAEEAMSEAESGSEAESENGQSAESGSEAESGDEQFAESGSEVESGDELSAESGSEAESESGDEQSAESENETEAETAEEQQMSESESEAETETEEETAEEQQMSESESETETESEEEEAGIQLGASIERVNVREGASTDTESKALLKPGNKVIILENREDGWSLVKYESDAGIDAGYVKTEYLVPAEQLRVVAENVNVRSEPNSDSEDNKIGKFEGGEEVPVLDGGDGEWSEIAFEKDGDVETAYVKSEFLSEYNYLDSDSAIIAEYKSMLAGEGQNVEELMAGLAAEAEVSAAETSAAETEAAVAENGLPLWPKDPVEAQFKLAKWLVPDLATVGIIYTRGNQETRELVGVYKDTAEEYNMELVEATVTSLEDIDFAAAELVGEVYGILIIDDEIVNSVVNVVTAYADEVGIPVIGSSEEQVKNGCAAAVDNGTVYFSQGELDKLGISLDLGQ